MSGCNYFPFLKTILCFLFFTSAGVVFGRITVQEPDSIMTKSDKDFYVEYDAKRELWFGMELIRQENVNWWKKRLAYEAYMHFELQERYRQMITTMIEAPTQAEIDAAKIYSPFEREMQKNRKFIDLLDRNSNDNIDCGTALKRITTFDIDDVYAGAVRVFAYNLKHYKEGGETTWVAYASRVPIARPLYLEKNFDVGSPDIMMAVTVKISNTFYSPLGVFESPIAKVFDMKTGNTAKKISVPFLSFVARAVGAINPGVKYMVDRLGAPMRNIFKSSGIHYSISGFKQKVYTAPYICYEKGKSPSSLRHDFVLVDPYGDIEYKISNKHWISTSPYFSCVDSLDVKEYPFLVTDRIELGNYTAKDQVHVFVSKILEDVHFRVKKEEEVLK